MGRDVDHDPRERHFPGRPRVRGTTNDEPTRRTGATDDAHVDDEGIAKRGSCEGLVERRAVVGVHVLAERVVAREVLVDRESEMLVSLLDSYWPASFAIESMPRAMTTVGYTMQLLCDPRKLAPAEPLFYRARAVAGADNFVVEMRELWSGDAIVGMNQQTFAILT